MTTLINNRYQLEAKLGAGGMGTVYRALDRLNGRFVALKLLDKISGDKEKYVQLALALAREFEVLSSLRHPFVISVIDYGFDDRYRPFFTMDLLAEADPLLATTTEPVELLLQLLQALAYLHRQGVIHRDLKPDNVLVIADQVKVLDFGLAIAPRQSPEESLTAGTLPYMAPEIVLHGAAPSRQSDLYSVGVMAYQMFAGHYPYDITNMNTLLEELMMRQPDLAKLRTSEAMSLIIAQLLYKQPEQRYQSAGQVIEAICTATQRPLPPETVAIRESYLQAARFTGREDELDQLLDALDELVDGKGGMWLIGGESGVGKSRLLAELRTYALVDGVLTLSGQSVAVGGRPYELWRGVVRWLALDTDLSLADAAVLKPLILDIADLLGKDVPAAPPLEPEMSQNRLFRVIAGLLAKQQRPLLILLEDLHWIGGISLALLNRLKQLTATAPLLFIGSYRHDERPDLPTLLPDANHMILDRLDAAAIADLAASMLGQAGRDQWIVQRLRQETEGNPFFLVEVVRALAETAGQLSHIDRHKFPTEIIAGGIQAIVEHRLSRLTPTARLLLSLAATMGRQLNLTVLRQFANSAALPTAVSLDNWLAQCAATAFLTVHEEQWEFAHEKLRTGILHKLTPEERTTHHQEVAQALEAVYPDDVAYVDALAHHWQQAGNALKERHYTILAGEQARDNYANEEALFYFDRALALTSKDESDRIYQLLLAREAIYHLLGRRKAQAEDLEALTALLNERSAPEQQARVALRRARFAHSLSQYDTAIAAAQMAVAQAQTVAVTPLAAELLAEAHNTWGAALMIQGQFDAAKSYYQSGEQYARTANNKRQIARCIYGLSSIAFRQGRYAAAQALAEQVLALYNEIGDRAGQSASLNFLGSTTTMQSDYAQARQYYERALMIRREIGDRPGESASLNSLGATAYLQGDYQSAITHYHASLQIKRDIQDRWGEGMCLNNLGLAAYGQGNYTVAVPYLEQSLAICREIEDRMGEAASLNSLGSVAYAQRNIASAHDHFAQALAIQQEIGDRWGEGLSLNNLGAAALAEKHWSQAEEWYEQGALVHQELNHPHDLVENWAGLAKVAIARGATDTAYHLVQQVMTYLTENPRLNGSHEPLRELRFTWEVWQALGETAAAEQILHLAVAIMQLYLDQNDDPIAETRYLAQPDHQLLWQAAQTAGLIDQP